MNVQTHFGRARRYAAVAGLGAVALAGTSAFYGQVAGAHVTTATLNMSCGVAGAVAINYTVEHAPVPAVSGGPLTVVVDSAMTPPAGVAGITVTGMTINIPVPAEVTSGSVAVSGGNFTLASQNLGAGVATVKLTAASGVTVGTIQVPRLTFSMTLAGGIDGKTIVFQGPSTIDIATNIGITDTCKADAGNPPLASVPVGSSGATTTVGAPGSTTTVGHGDHDHGPTTTKPAVTTTKPAVTTTKPAVTTTKPAVTTTKPGVTTTRPMTTTTKATSTDPIAAFFAWLSCLFSGKC